MIKNLSLQMILGIVRHMLTVACGGLIAQGTLTNNNVNIIVGLVTGLTGFVWSMVHKGTVSQALNEAVKDSKLTNISNN